MADSTPILPQMAAAADDREIVFNGVVDALSPSSLYGRDYENCTGLVFAGFGGFFNAVEVANWTVNATASNTNYVVAHRTTGAVSVSTATTNRDNTTTYLYLYELVAGGSAITSYKDKRQALGASTIAGGGAGTASTLDFDTDGTLAANSDAKIATQKATKTYVDANVAGLSWKQAVRVATTANGTLATAFENGDTVDGVTLATGDRILIKNQSSGAENGIYVVAASGAPARSTDADSGAELVNASVYVSEGTANADTQWVCTNNATITVNTTALVFAQLTSGSGAIGSNTFWDAKGDLAGGTGADAAARLPIGSDGQVLTADSGETTGMKWATNAAAKVIQIACSDETTALTTGTAKMTFRMPYAMTLNAGSAGVRASLSTAQATSGGGGIVTVDINEGGSTILSTKLTIDNTEKTSTTAAAAAVISDTSLADDAEITIDIDVIGDGTARGLKISLIGT